MYDNTLSLVIGGSTCVFTKINQDNFTSEYIHRTEGWEGRLRIRHTRTGTLKGGMRDRHNVELSRTVFPAVPGEVAFVEKAYLVVEQPVEAASIGLSKGLTAWLIDANLTKLINWE